MGVKAIIRRGVGPESDAKESEEEDGMHFDGGFVVNGRKEQEVKEKFKGFWFYRRRIGRRGEEELTLFSYL